MTDPGTIGTTDLAVEEAFECDACGHRWYYTRARCPNCEGTSASPFGLGTGTVVTWTDARVTPPDVRAPNRLVLADFDGVRLVAQLAGDAVDVGDRVRFAGEYRLREAPGARGPRLTAVEE